ncbi:TIM-barrel domain-containing protein [Bacillus gobiensis]|uniref:TIM-barrel domain-containing protein n=1 Tax=Bacillus gobiensis TaxID=1441095 RepID=UPI003D1F3126
MRRHSYFQKVMKLLLIISLVFSAFTVRSAFARDSEFTRQGSGPMYWITYEHQFGKDVFMPEHRLKDNVDWMAKNFRSYGYDMISTDGWIEGSTLLNENGYVVSHNDRWMSDPIYMDGRDKPYLKPGTLFNGDFEYATTEGWDIKGNADSGVDKSGARNNFKFYFYKNTPFNASASQKVTGLEKEKTYRLSAWATLGDFSGSNQFTDETIGSFAEMKISQDGKVVKKVPIELSSSYKNYTIDVASVGEDMTVEFVIDSKRGNASFQLDDITFAAVDQDQPSIPDENVVVNGGFEQSETEGWTYEGDFAHGRNDDPEGDKSLWTYSGNPNKQIISQTVKDLPDGNYRISSKAKGKNGVADKGAALEMKLSGYDKANPEATVKKPVTSENWASYAETVKVTSGQLKIEFIVDPTEKQVREAGIDIDDVSIVYDNWKGYPHERYPDGHTWKHWAEYVKAKGMKFGIYYNPLWISPEVVKNPDKYKVKGTDTPVADLVITEPQDLGNGKTLQGDRFDGGQGGERALYWLNVDHPDAERFLKGYVDFFAEQGALYLRVDFLSWYESGYDKGLGQIGKGHTREQYRKALQWMDEATEKKDIFLSLVMPDLNNHGEYEQQYGDMIRIDEDAFSGGWEHISGRRQEWTNSWSQWANPFQGFTGFADISGRGSMVNDGDFLKLNSFKGRYAEDEKKTAISLFTMAGSPITIADQYDTIGDNYKYYQNPELIELNKLGFVGKPIFYSNKHYKNNVSRDSERWAGQLPDGSWVVSLSNRSDTSKGLSIDFKKDLGIKEEAFTRNLWEHKDLGYRTMYSEMLEPHDSTVLKLIPKNNKKVYQTEVASYQGGAIFDNEQMGYDGFGYLKGLDKKGSKVTIAVDMPEAGQFPLGIKYGNENTEASTLSLSVEDKKMNVIDAATKVSFPSTGDKWGTVEQSVQLNKGVNLITLEFTGEDTGSTFIDSIQFGTGTGQLVNGDFEMGNETGWKVNTFGTTVWHGVDKNDAYEGYKQYLYSPNEGGKVSSKQTIVELKDGEYKVSAMAKLMPHLDPSFSGGVAKMIVSQPGKENVEVTIEPNLKDPDGPVKQKWNADDFEYQKFSTDTINVTEGELTLEFYMEAPKADTSLQLDNVKLQPADSEAPQDAEVQLYNKGFEQGFTGWSRTNMVNQSTQSADDKSFARIAGKEAYSSDIWQFGNAPIDGNYQLSINTRKSGNFDNASLYVTYSGGTKEVPIPANSDWKEVKVPNIQLMAGEVVKVGVIADGQAESVLDLDDVKMIQKDPTEHQNVSFIESLDENAPYSVSEDGKSIVLNSKNREKIKVEFVQEDTAKVWMEPTGTFKKKASYVVDGETADVVPKVADKGDYILIQTDKLSLRANKSPFKLGYYNAANTKMLTEHSDGNSLGYDGDTGVYSAMNLDPKEHFFGLGMDRDSQSFDRRGHRVVMNNGMKGGYGGNTSDISGTFLTSTKGYGLYFDNTYENVTFDMGATDSGKYSFSSPNGEMIYYFMAGEKESTLTDIMKSYADLTGTAPLPPQWAMGYIQSKYGYKSWKEVNKIVDTFRQKQIPLDGMILDVYWAKDNHYFDMTWSEAFANPKESMEALAKKGIKTVPIVDPYIQVTASNFNEGDKNGYFVKDASGNTVIYDAWYGKAGLVDFTNPNAVDWFNSQVKALHDAGVKGYWIDLNEPEIGTDSLRHKFTKGSAAEIRNVYALNEAKSFYQGHRKYSDNRLWSLSRSGFSGIQEYGTTVWSGDVDASWESLRHNMQLGLSSSMSGMPYFTTDIGGFYGKPTAELYTRWMQAGSFMPIFRAHNCECGDPTNTREPWAFGAEAEGIVKQAINQRYKLLPYIYSAAKQTTEGNGSLMRPLVMDYTTDPNVYGIEDQWMFGPNMLVAPISLEGMSKRSIYLPEGTWYDWSTQKTFAGGQSIEHEADLSTIPVFVKEGAIIPQREVQNYTNEKAPTEITLKAYPKQNGTASSFTLYEDDGQTYKYENGQSADTKITAASTDDTTSLQIAAMKGSFDGRIQKRTWTAEIKANAGEKGIDSVKRNKKKLKLAASKEAIKTGNDVWYYDAKTDMLYVKTAQVSTDEEQVITAKKGKSAGKDKK